MYCPDDVIQKAYHFLHTVHVGQECSDKDKETALGALMLAIRKDLISRKALRETELPPDSFKVLKAT